MQCVCTFHVRFEAFMCVSERAHFPVPLTAGCTLLAVMQTLANPFVLRHVMYASGGVCYVRYPLKGAAIPHTSFQLGLVQIVSCLYPLPTLPTLPLPPLPRPSRHSCCPCVRIQSCICGPWRRCSLRWCTKLPSNRTAITTSEGSCACTPVCSEEDLQST